MASKTKVTLQKEEMLEHEGPETPPESPLLDRSNAAVKALIRTAKKRGYVTHDRINSLTKEVNSEQIEDILAMFSEMGINVVESEEAETEEASEEAREEPEEEESNGELVEVARTTPSETKKSEPGERTDDPVRMYLREMGSVELLSREGEIAIAKRIVAGREAMIAGLCESPLTFQAIIIWRDELNDGKVFLRDIIDLEATYAGPDAKGVPPPTVQETAPSASSGPWASRRRWRPRPRRRPRPRSGPSPTPCPAKRKTASRRRANSTMTISKARCRSPPSRPSSSPRCWRPSTTSRIPTSAFATCRTRTSSSSSAWRNGGEQRTF